MHKNELAALKRDTDNKRLSLVKYFWDHGSDKEKERKWKDLSYNEESSLKAMEEVLAMDLESRRILVSSSPDQLRWGKNNEGKYNFEEAK